MEPPRERVTALLEWYRGEARDLPWRRTRDPWAIWVSEVMLQQTRVEHVIPYFERFLSRFPRPQALAAAPLDEALALWSGLGYYRRVRLLHRAVSQLAGEDVPTDPVRLRALPGVGDYTAAAIASIAFGVVVPVLDGNVERVLCRLLGEGGDPRRAATRRRLLSAAAELLAPTSPGESNQALMELGATVCVPRVPRCAACPLASACRARSAGTVQRLPWRAPRREAQEVELVVGLVEREGRLLLFRRDDEDELLAGTWELPWVRRPLSGGHAAAEAAFAGRYGLRLRLGARLRSVRHAITFRRLLAVVHSAEWIDEEVPLVAERPGSAAWFTRDQLGELPASSLLGKALGRPRGGQPRRRVR